MSGDSKKSKLISCAKVLATCGDKLHHLLILDINADKTVGNSDLSYRTRNAGESVQLRNFDCLIFCCWQLETGALVLISTICDRTLLCLVLNCTCNLVAN